MQVRLTHSCARPSYLQFASLTLLLVIILSISLLFLYTHYTDIQSRLAALNLEMRADILRCAKAYVDNRCEPSTRLPVLEKKCSEWEDCMAREVVVDGKTRVVAETLAEIVNGFVDFLSWKTMVSPQRDRLAARPRCVGPRSLASLAPRIVLFSSSSFSRSHCASTAPQSPCRSFPPVPSTPHSSLTTA